MNFNKQIQIRVKLITLLINYQNILLINSQKIIKIKTINNKKMLTLKYNY
jgi:hypothetical protein